MRSMRKHRTPSVSFKKEKMGEGEGLSSCYY